MLLIFLNIEDFSTYCFRSQFDSGRRVGEPNVWGDILIGLFLIYQLGYKLVSFRSSWFAELYLRNNLID